MHVSWTLNSSDVGNSRVSLKSNFWNLVRIFLDFSSSFTVPSFDVLGPDTDASDAANAAVVYGSVVFCASSPFSSSISFFAPVPKLQRNMQAIGHKN